MLVELAPQVIEAVDVPALVSGTISDGRRLAAAVAIGGARVAIEIRFIAKVENH